MITLTAEQAQQIEEALEDIVRVFKFETGAPVEALATIRAARAQEQAEHEPVAWIAVADEMPKPHKPVLVRYVITSPVYGGTRSKVIRAQWIPAKTEESNDDDHFEYDEETDTYYIPEGWYELVDNWDEYSSIHVCEGDITHWMRLPEFPNAAPVRTKDLTDEEQLELARSSVGKSRHWLVAAVIAAYKEKNK